ncbi:MAG: AbrB/MazE/SpoVT family DNA-binding domain-containing protein [Bacteriovoracia bacterium]
MTVKVSPKYQVVIPEEVRSALGIKAGSKVEVVAKGKVAYLVPVPTLSEVEEELQGKLNQQKIRDKKDRRL